MYVGPLKATLHRCQELRHRCLERRLCAPAVIYSSRGPRCGTLLLQGTPSMKCAWKMQT
jgi:hypothetical protein